MGQFIIAAVVGLGLFLLGWFQYRKTLTSRTWPSVPGRLLAAKVEWETTRGDQDTADSTTFYPAIQYEYEVGSATFRGSMIAFDRRGYQKRQTAEKALLGFPVGSSVQVFYDPARPGECVLERKSSTGLPLMVIGGVIVLVVIASALMH